MLDPREIQPETVRPLRRREYEALVEQGLFESERVELLEGALVQMSPHGPAHDDAIDRLTELLVIALRGRARIRAQGAFAASDDSEPEPDLAVVPLRDYADEHPRQAWLLIEVADSSLAKDRTVKARLYARSAVPQYWVVNVAAKEIEVFTDPHEGAYRSRTIVRSGGIALDEFPDVIIELASVFGARFAPP